MMKSKKYFENQLTKGFKNDSRKDMILFAEELAELINANAEKESEIGKSKKKFNLWGLLSK